MAEWIVVVDDDTTNLKAAGRVLSDNGMRVTALKSGSLLLDYLGKNTPDLILLDVLMPEMDGFETMRALREKPETRDIPVIFLSASEEEQAAEGLALGAMDFVRKPFVAELLVRRVRQAVELTRLRRLALSREGGV
ncbi:MAG: response regulator [Oscillospiraceae bacterium]|nr:response regulator [Oscillospiraceae bacterium]